MTARTSASVSLIPRPVPRQALRDRAVSRTNLSDQPVASARSLGVTVGGMMLMALNSTLKAAFVNWLTRDSNFNHLSGGIVLPTRTLRARWRAASAPQTISPGHDQKFSGFISKTPTLTPQAKALRAAKQAFICRPQGGFCVGRSGFRTSFQMLAGRCSPSASACMVPAGSGSAFGEWRY
jgi:hypothetical protein